MKCRTIEKNIPVTVALIFTIGYICYERTLCTNQLLPSMDVLLSLSITIASISLGFISTIISVVLSMTTSRIMKKMYITNTDELLIGYITESLLVNVATIIFAGYLMFLDVKLISSNQSYVWLFLANYGVTCSIRITWTLLKLVKIVNSESKNKVLHNCRHKPEKIVTPNKSNNSDSES